MAASPVLPARFGVLFSSPEAVADFMVRHESAIDRFLGESADKQEWAVKGFLNRERAAAWLLETDPDLAERHRRLPATPGARYVQEKQLRAAALAQLEQRAALLTGQIVEAVRGLAPALRPLRLQGPDPVRPGDSMLLHYAVFLAADQVADFRARIDALAQQREAEGWTLECSGPWPPYSFCPEPGTEDPR
jgi:hypothetical protein